jgi:hypothetical protein
MLGRLGELLTEFLQPGGGAGDRRSHVGHRSSGGFDLGCDLRPSR